MSFEITEQCTACGLCEAECTQGAIHITGADMYAIDPRLCTCVEGVDVVRCRQVCAAGAIVATDYQSQRVR